MFTMYRVTQDDVKFSSAGFDDEEVNQLHVNMGFTLTNFQLGVIGASFFTMIGVFLAACVAVVVI